ncbi:MAG: hypothetical protein RJA29_402 [Pseudomonadota bacterium]
MFSCADIRRGNTNDHSIFDDGFATSNWAERRLVPERDARGNGLPVMGLRGIHLEVEQGGDVIVGVYG